MFANYIFAPDEIQPLAKQPYMQLQNVKETQAMKKWVAKMQSTEQGSSATDFTELQRTIANHGNTMEAWKRNPELNRYKDMPCFDQTRVVLNDGLQPDYIHANHINGYCRPNCYILTQGPLDNTICDFWRMVWQERVATVVMVTRLTEKDKVKCSKYFPLSNENDFQAGIFRIGLAKVERRLLCTTSLLIVRNMLTNQCRPVVHVWYSLWPDQGIPTDPNTFRPFLNFVKVVNMQASRTFYASKHCRGQPLVFHCSAGIGRSAVLIILDILTEALNHNDFIDPYELVQHMRKMRYHSVHTKIQLVFVYDYFLTLLLQRRNVIQDPNQVES